MIHYHIEFGDFNKIVGGLRSGLPRVFWMCSDEEWTPEKALAGHYDNPAPENFPRALTPHELREAELEDIFDEAVHDMVGWTSYTDEESARDELCYVLFDLLQDAGYIDPAVYRRVTRKASSDDMIRS